MASLSNKRYFFASVIVMALSSCSENVDSGGKELIFRGQIYPDNVLIVREGYTYFGDEGAAPPNFLVQYQNDGNYVDAGLVAFSLNTDTAQCGSYSFSFAKGEDGSLKVKGTCVRDHVGKCYPDKVSPTVVEYILNGSEMPHRFHFYVKGMFDDTFQLMGYK